MSATTLQGLLRFMLRDLAGSSRMRSLWVFAASLILGIALVAACSGLLQIVRGGFDTQQRNLFGGDLQVSQREPVSDAQLRWMNEHGSVSLLMELRTMLGTPEGGFTVVELQSVDDTYPLYGRVRLQPEQSLQDAVSRSADGTWGAAVDPVLMQQLDLAPGDSILIGQLQLEVRAEILEQPDRSLRADLRGPPVIIDEAALNATGLVLPTSLVDYDYRVRTDTAPDEWREQLRSAFPDASWEVDTVDERGDFIGERLDQVASVLLLIGFSTLFIGGLGVANSISAYLQSKFSTLATLQSLGCRDAHVVLVYVGQVVLLGVLASTVGALIGSTVAWLAALSLAERLPLDAHASNLFNSTLLSVLFGTLTAFVFSLPSLGRTLSLPTARLLRGLIDDQQPLAKPARTALIVSTLLLILLLLILIPEPLIGLAFVTVLALLLALLQLTVKGIRAVTGRLSHHPLMEGRLELRLASASLSGVHSSLRPMLLSLGTALTLLVAASSIIAATVHSLDTSIPSRAPSLVLYDLPETDREAFAAEVHALDGFQDMNIAPLVLGRLTQVNGQALSKSGDTRVALEANDEHKLSYRSAGIDNISVDRGEWWPEDYAGPALVAMEDREADQIGLVVGDRLTFTILGTEVPATLAVIYSQANFETSFWLEAVFTPEVLDPFIDRHIGSIRLAADSDIPAMDTLGAAFPGVVIIRTARILEAARSILAGASLGVFAIALVSLTASILVMASVVAVNRQRQVYEASVMHALGTRMRVVLRAVSWEYALLAAILTLFATALGSLIAYLVLEFWLELPVQYAWLAGLLVAAFASSACLLAGWLWLVRSLSATPAELLRRAA